MREEIVHQDTHGLGDSWKERPGWPQATLTHSVNYDTALSSRQTMCQMWAPQETNKFILFFSSWQFSNAPNKNFNLSSQAFPTIQI